MPKTIKHTLPHEDAIIDELRSAMLEKIRNVPEEGIEVEYLKKTFRVYKNVFLPGEDSKALIRNFTIYPGETVLDVGTGSGVISIFSAYKGATKIVAVDINPDAINAAKINAKIHGFDKIIDIRLSDAFEAIKGDEKFDVITSNPPMSCRKACDLVESSIYDSDFRFHKTLFDQGARYLKEKGRMYLTQSNFGAIDRMLEMANHAGYDVELIGENVIPNDFRIFYAFELIKM